MQNWRLQSAHVRVRAGSSSVSGLALSSADIESDDGGCFVSSAIIVEFLPHVHLQNDALAENNKHYLDVSVRPRRTILTRG